MSKKVIIDCDVGVDDALALILAFHSPELIVEAVTGVNGNVPLDTVFPNIQKVLSLIQPKRKPIIARGADRPLKGKTIHAHSVHGKTGLGDAKIDLREGEEWWQKYPGPADELILELAYQFPDELILIAVGPLTNLALALKKDVEGMKKLKKLVIMGGSVRTRGNVTPYAEFNIFSDPLAAKIVFESGIPITLVPLDATHQVFLTSHWMEEEIVPLRTSFSDFLIKATGYDTEAHRFKNRESIFLHDPLAVGAVIDSELVKTERLPLHVDTNEGEYYGRITEVKKGPKMDVCLGVDAERFLELFVSRLRKT
ncbi:MAG: nucleoside hydrolase [Deltaproteobacteria bacterium]|nr:nucleoside hydrolase [Deltaproteobacteria bacterium]MBM4324233.1 nucleoside hydrolase [Deltaproteobacteria bacterium]MBM4347687.1 nucleoside hydrolase [Deltaproteobacteria bacterium]